MKKIILIEDDMPTVDVYKTALEAAGFEVIVANFGGQALKIINMAERGKEALPDIILLDIILPDINGMEILKEIRKGKQTKDLPVFILSNYKGDHLKEMGYDLNSERFLLKTEFTPSQLVEAVRGRIG